MDSTTIDGPTPPLPEDVPPAKVYVELTTECNLDCAMCIRHSWDEPGGTMAPETFGRVVELLIVLVRMDDARLRDVAEHDRHADEMRAAFCDGGASRLTWACEELRQALGLPCDWREVVERERDPDGT